jgi:hypothetical protein
VNAQIVVDLPEHVWVRASRLAELTSRSLADILVDALDLSLPALASPEMIDIAWDDLSNEMVLQLAQLEMDARDDRRLSQLLHQQQAGFLSEFDRSELARLMQIYQVGLLRKAQALAEAVKRGLQAPLSS